MMKIIQSPWFASVLGAVMYMGVTVALLKPEKLQGARVESHQDTAPKIQMAGPSWNFRNPEMEQMVAELQQEREALKEKEKQLQLLETRLLTDRQELNIVTQTVQRLQKEFDQNVLRLKEEEAGNLKKMGKMYGGMAPEATANIFREMPDDDVVKVLAYMKVDEVSAILQSFSKMGKTEARRAAMLSDRMRRTISPAPAAKP
jgi:flagellar motility protein MotE (MotC chaperone)